MIESDIELFHNSFERCMARPDFLDIFYERFVETSAEVREKFRGTDFRKQKRVLRVSLYSIVSAIVRRESDLGFLSDIARTHSASGYGIKPAMYQLWLDCLVIAVAQCDDEFNDEIARVWIEAMKQGIVYMVQHSG